MEQTILSAITQHMQGSQVLRARQNGFTKGRSCLTNLISLYKVTHLEDEERGAVCLDFTYAFHTASRGIPLEKLAPDGLGVLSAG